MTDEDVDRSKRPLGLYEIAPDVGAGAGLRRFSISRLIHGITIKTSGGKRLAETKEHFFRATVSMSEQRLWMRTGRRGENSQRGCVCRQHYFFDADARLDHV